MGKTLPSNAEHVGSIPCQGAKIPHASWPKNQNIKQKQYCNKFNKRLWASMVAETLKNPPVNADDMDSIPDSGISLEIPRTALVGYSPYGHKESDTTEAILACTHVIFNQEHIQSFEC